jgi:hypothetical protein
VFSETPSAMFDYFRSDDSRSNAQLDVVGITLGFDDDAESDSNESAEVMLFEMLMSYIMGEPFRRRRQGRYAWQVV